MSEPTASAASPSQDGVNRQFSWYEPELTEVKEPARTILAEYSKIPEEKIIDHVKEFPYPCIGSFRFLDITICNSSAYPEILSRLKDTSDVYLDLGCAMGQDIRHLVHQGAPQSQIYGSDLLPQFIELGYDLFADRDTLACQFITGDIFDSSSELFRRLSEKVDIINAASFFHLFDWDTQVKLAKQVIKLLRPKAGSMVVGRHVGDYNSREVWANELDSKIWRHNLDSWRRLWEQVGRETRTEWSVDVTGEEWKGITKVAHNGETTFKMQFVVRRV